MIEAARIANPNASSPTIIKHNIVYISAERWKAKSPTLRKMREIMRSYHMAISTEYAYINACADFFAFTNCGSADCLNDGAVERYLSHLSVDKKVSASTQNQAFNAILFLFRHVLDKEFGKIKAQRATQKVNIPEWLTKDEIQSLFNQLSGDWLLLAKLAYGTGLRLMELLRLRIKDVDFGNQVVVVKDGKGKKDRIVPLPKSLVAEMQARVRMTKSTHETDLAAGLGRVWMPDALSAKYPRAASDFKWQWLFPSREICRAEDGAMRRHHLFPNGFQTALRLAGQRSGINKRVHPHILRHSFATHFLENGGNLQTLQKLMGHKEVTTTMIYTHCVDLHTVRSPLDQLMAA